jgi:hypothetical protein
LLFCGKLCPGQNKVIKSPVMYAAVIEPELFFVNYVSTKVSVMGNVYVLKLRMGLAVFLLAAPTAGYGQKNITGPNIISDKNCPIEVKRGKYVLFKERQPETGKKKIKLARVKTPVKLAEEHIYTYPEVSMLPMANSTTPLDQYLLRKMIIIPVDLPDGRYSVKLANLVVSKRGKVAYCVYEGLDNSGGNAVHHIPHVLTDVEHNNITVLNNLPTIIPAKKNGIPVPVRLSINYCVEIKGGEMQLCMSQIK